MISDNFWPRSVMHLSQPYDDGVSEHVVIAEVSDDPESGCKGFRRTSTALIPLKIVDEILVTRGGIGHEVDSWGPHPCVGEGVVFDTRFWIKGRVGTEEKFQTILNSWRHHDREVTLPDSVMLMTYGLVPRYVDGGMVCWDDPQGPVYEVIRAHSHVNFNEKNTSPLVLVTMRRDYLEDYCSLKDAAAVAVYFEERFDSGDDTLVKVLAERSGAEFHLPGRVLTIANLNDQYNANAPHMSKVWGARLMLKPQARPISEPKPVELKWPDFPAAVSSAQSFEHLHFAYVSDSVLQEYECRSEFTIFPESGGVSYGGWWATSYTSRFGREHIRVELKKLYEGCPQHVIRHWHRFAVTEAVANNDKKAHGESNVAIRAKEFLYGFLRVTQALEQLSDQLGTSYSQADIGELDWNHINRHGWWTPESIKPLTVVIRRSATQEEFLVRATNLFKLFELLKPAALRNLVLQTGLPKDKVKTLGSLKLLGTICQLFYIASQHGYELPAGADQVVPIWDAKILLPGLKKVFALNGLRDLQSHHAGEEKNKDIKQLCAVFGIDVSSTASGWGFAIDTLYDGLIESMNYIAVLISTDSE